MQILNFQLRSLIDREIIELGFNYRLKGTRYIVDIVTIAAMRGESFLLEPCMKVIFPAVAQLRDTSAAAVERSIRYAVGEAWLHGNYEKLSAIFPRCRADDTTPTAMQFIQFFAWNILPKLRKFLHNESTILGK